MNTQTQQQFRGFKNSFNSSVLLGSSLQFRPAVEISFRSSNLSSIWNCCTVFGISFLNRTSSGEAYLPSALAVWLEMPNWDNCWKHTDWYSSFCDNVWLLLSVILAYSFGVGLAHEGFKMFVSVTSAEFTLYSL